MRICKPLAAFLSGAIMTGSASAAVVTTFGYSGQAVAGSASGATTSFPTGGVLRVEDPLANFAALIGLGAENPFIYAAGAAAAGGSAAQSNVVVSLQITNDTGDSAVASLAGLIFPGAVGIANPDFTDPSCSTAAIEACSVFLDGTRALNAGETASVDYSATLDGAVIFDGSISVAAAGMSSTFSGVALNGFGVSPANGNLFTWQETTFSGLSLGVFLPGETKTLTFLVAASVATNGRFGCASAPFACPLALAGFGDPPPGNGGVIIGGGSTSRIAAFESTQTTPSGSGGLVIRPFTGSSPFFSVSFSPTMPSPVPIPGAVYLFGLGVAGLGVMRRRAKGGGDVKAPRNKLR